MQTAREHRLPKPQRYFCVVARFAFITSSGSEKLTSAHRNPSCEGVCCAHDAQEKKEKAKRECGRRNVI